MEASGPAQQKKAMRALVRKALHGLAPAKRALEEEFVVAAVQAQPEWERARTVFLYRSVAPELSTVGLVLAAWRAGKRVGLPRVSGSELVFHEVSSWTELRPGFRGIPEPSPSAPVLPASEAQLVIVPGLAFDTAGRRLGRGAGFYDRYLPQVQAPKWGVAFRCQMMDAIPTEGFDQGVDRVISPATIQI